MFEVGAKRTRVNGTHAEFDPRGLVVPYIYISTIKSHFAYIYLLLVSQRIVANFHNDHVYVFDVTTSFSAKDGDGTVIVDVDQLPLKPKKYLDSGNMYYKNGKLNRSINYYSAAIAEVNNW